MGIPNTQPMRFTPRGITDAFDATDKFAGACRQLSNLVFDQSNPELVVSRPGVLQLVNLVNQGFINPQFISVHISVGQWIYGMVATDRFPGHDEPFAYNIAVGACATIIGCTAANTPISPQTVGDWTPPTMTVVGTMVLITHPGYTNQPKYRWGSIAQGGTGTLWGSVAQGGSGALWGDRFTFGVIDITQLSGPVFNATTTAITPLTNAPTAVVNFSNRAYFAVGNLLEYTDVLTNPPTMTSPTQQFTVGDSDNITAMSGLPVQTTGSGILQTMTIFKKNQTWQLGGDPATWNLSLSYSSLTVGTNQPRSLAQSPFGLYFSSSGGPYFIDLTGTLRAVTHSLNDLEPDIVSPFQNAQYPSRWAGAYNANIYRVAGVGLFRGIQIFGDYWFDEHRRRWNGLHSFPYDCASPVGNYFVLSSVYVPGVLIQSYTSQQTSFVNTDLGTQFNCNVVSCTFPKVDWISMKQVVESQIELSASNAPVTYIVYAQDEQGRTLGQVSITVSTGGKAWGSFNWGDGTLWGTSNLWGGGSAWGPTALRWGDGSFWLGFNNYWTNVGGSGLRWGSGRQGIPSTYPCEWTAPLVFEKMQLRVDVSAAAEVGIGTFYARYQKTGYMTFGPPGNAQ